MSSDNNGSMVLFDEVGNIKGIMVAKIDTYMRNFATWLKGKKIALSDAKTTDCNHGKSKTLSKKGAIRIRVMLIL